MYMLHAEFRQEAILVQLAQLQTVLWRAGAQCKGFEARAARHLDPLELLRDHAPRDRLNLQRLHLGHVYLAHQRLC